MGFLVPRPGNFNFSELMSVQEALTLPEERTLYLIGSISDEKQDLNSALSVIDSLIFLDKLNQDPIKLVIDSEGGVMELGLVLYDIMQSITSPVYTVARVCGSVATIILAGGEKGHRFIYPHSRVTLHSPFISGEAPARSETQAEFERLKKLDDEILIKHGCKKTKEEIEKDKNREILLRGKEAVEYGIVDKVITPQIHRELFGKPFKVEFPTESKKLGIKEIAEGKSSAKNTKSHY